MQFYIIRFRNNNNKKNPLKIDNKMGSNINLSRNIDF